VRVCFITTTSFASDPRALAEVNSTRKAGHEVVGVAPDARGIPWVRSAPSRPGLLGLGGRNSREALEAAARECAAHLYVPVQKASIPIARHAARSTQSGYMNRPSWEPDDRDSVLWTAPEHPDAVQPASGELPQAHVPGYRTPTLAPDRPVVVVHRTTGRGPGRYLEAAIARSGADTVHMDHLDWDQVPSGTAAVVIVESPLPSPAIHGKNPGIPVVFWAHHGEHHVETNIRLQRRLGANVVALAHSWHLAYRFSGLVERLPFAVAPELAPRDFRPHADRRYDVAFVGSRPAGPRYQRREAALENASRALGRDRVAVRDGLSPEEMLSLYRSARIVPDDGAGRHLPITMRFFEATGAGALLVTREAPGSALILDAHSEFVPMDDDAGEQLVGLAGSDTEMLARAGHGAVWERHTYDQRVSDLMAMIDRARSGSFNPPLPEDPRSGLADAVAAFPDAQRVLDLGSGVGSDLEDREVWDYDTADERAEPDTFNVSVIAGGASAQRARAVAAARLAVVTPTALAAEIEPLVTQAKDAFRRFERDGSVVFTFGSSGYRVSSEPDPE